MQIPGGVIMSDSSRVAELEKRVAALETLVEKFTSTNNVSAPCPFHSMGDKCRYDGVVCCWEEPCSIILDRSQRT